MIRLTQSELNGLLDVIIANGPYDYHLFQNDLTPDDASVIGDFTESDFDGYAAGAATNWTAASWDAGPGTSLTEADALVFTRGPAGGAQDVYGYFVTNFGGDLVWAERDDAAPRSMAANGDTYSLVPRLRLRSIPTI